MLDQQKVSRMQWSSHHHKIPAATNTASHMSMLCYGVDITLMDTCVSVTCSNMHHTTDFFSEGSDWYSLRLQPGNTFPGTWHLCTLQNVIKHRKSSFGDDNCHTRISKNNIMDALRRVIFFCNTVDIDSELLAWAATFNSLEFSCSIYRTLKFTVCKEWLIYSTHRPKKYT